MTDTVVVNENRSVLERFRNWYKEKLIDTGKAKDFEEKLDKKIEIEKKAIYILGSIATVVLIFIPADGPVGEICAAVATPLLAELVSLKGKITKKVVLGAKRKLEADFIKADGSSDKIEVPDFDFNDITNDIIHTKDTAVNYSHIFKKENEEEKEEEKEESRGKTL